MNGCEERRAPLSIIINDGNNTSSSCKLPRRTHEAKNADRITLGDDFNIRDLHADDFDAAHEICREAFPLDYGDNWLKEVCAGRFISFGLFHNERLISLLVAEVKLLESCDVEVRSSL